MKHLLVMGSILLSTACADSSFSGSSSKQGGPANAIPAENPAVGDAIQDPTEIGVDPAASNLPSLEVTAKQCLAAINGEPTTVITLSQGDTDLANIPAGAIILLNLSGQAAVNLSQTDVSKLGGICIAVTGKSTASVDFTGTLAGIFYYSRGNADTNLNFGDSGTLKGLSTDVSGTSQLFIDGSKIDCDNLGFDGGGSSSVQCNGMTL